MNHPTSSSPEGRHPTQNACLPHAPSAPSGPLGACIPDRFELHEEIGSGAQGSVRRATDRVRRRQVAVKVLTGLGTEAVERFEREIAALHLLRIPGVARLIDAGTSGGTGFVAMEWVEGHPFPKDGPRPWSEVGPWVIGLVETLARVHAIGIIHCDLKPANVLIDPHEGPIVLDLGIASGRALLMPEDGTGEHKIAGTPRYMAPCLLDSQPHCAATDLFSVAVMTYEALTGKLLRPALEDGLFDPSPIEAIDVAKELDGRLPERPAVALTAILSGGGRDRIDAARLLRELNAGRESNRIGVPPSAEPQHLEFLFDARERVVLHRSTAARILSRAVEGDAGRVPEELERWLSLGIGALRDGRVRLEGHDIVRLERREAAEVFLARASSTDAESGGVWAESGIQDYVNTMLAELPERVGASDARTLLLELHGLVKALIGLGRIDEAVPVLEQWLVLALRCQDREPLHLLQFELRRSAEIRRRTEAMSEVTSAALDTFDQAAQSARARLAVAEQSGVARPGDASGLSLAWHAVRLFVARRFGDPSAMRKTMDEVRAWAASLHEPVPEIDAWEGFIAYHQEEFALARDHHLEAARYVTGHRLSSALVDAGSASLELGTFEETLDLAAQAERHLGEVRDDVLRLRIESLRRSCLYRADRAVGVDQDLVDVVRECEHPLQAGVVLVTEAAIAWRTGDLASLDCISRDAEQRFIKAGRASTAILPRVLRAHGCQTDEVLENAPSIQGLPPALAIQIDELCRRSGIRLAAEDRDWLRQARESCAQRDLDRRREVLSLRECAL